jgi:glucose-1-phosphate thymidylyltransferase
MVVSGLPGNRPSDIVSRPEAVKPPPSAMKAIIPLAGKGTRLRPHTHHTPKPLLKVAGKPVLSYIFDDLVALGVTEMVLIVGHLREEMEAWVRREYPDLRAHYVLQEVQDGTAGAVALAEPYVDDEVLIVFADAVLELDYSLVRTLDPAYSGVIWAKEVEDYQRFGVIVTNDDGTMSKIVEKPKEPISRLANIGLYFIRDHALLYEGIHHTLSAPPGPSGEYYLTDAFQYMADHGAKILTAPVEGWWDAGKPETLLETNAHLLATTRGGVSHGATVEGAEIVEPVRIEEGAVVRGGRIGPNVTIEHGARVEACEIRDTVVGHDAVLTNARLHDSLVGGHAIVKDVAGIMRITHHSVVEGDRG